MTDLVLDPAEAAEPRSGKGAADENFPVASRLIAPRLRPTVAAFYAFARAADDVADAPKLTPEEKRRRLDRYEAALDGGEGPAPALRLRAALAARGLDAASARRLLDAFRQDAAVGRYRDWDALMRYCALSAHPVGRFLLALHGEGPEAERPSDALCAALQVLNHLQDLKDDFRKLDRVYLPGDWLRAEGLEVEALAAPAASPALRRVIDRALDGCDALSKAAAPLPKRLRSRRLAVQAAATLALARRLIRRFDPAARPTPAGVA
jgi:squalene synthase HpnC